VDDVTSKLNKKLIAEKQRVSYACLSRLANSYWSCNSLNAADVVQLE